MDKTRTFYEWFGRMRLEERDFGFLDFRRKRLQHRVSGGEVVTRLENPSNLRWHERNPAGHHHKESDRSILVRWR